MGLRRALANPDIHWVGLHSAKALSTCVFPWFFGLNEKTHNCQRIYKQ